MALSANAGTTDRHALRSRIRRNEHAERSRQYVRDVRHASQLWADNRPAQALETPRSLSSRFRRRTTFEVLPGTISTEFAASAKKP